MPNVTMSHIAEVARVSQATVSFVLSGRERTNGSISAQTKQRVQEVARELGYRPNRSARALATGRSHLVGLCVRNLGLPHYAHVTQCAENELRLSPFHLLVSRWDNDFKQKDARLLDGIFPWPLDGVLALEAGEVLTKHWEKFEKWPAPIISMGGTNYHLENLDSIGIDLPRGVTQAITHLLEIGCQRIAFVSNASAQDNRECRAKAYAEVMAQHRRQPEYITLSDQSRRVAREQFKEYVAAHGCPDGVLCVNDEVALGVYRALCDLEIKVPQQVALIGCDGIEDMQYLECPLSTIVQPVEEMCRLAWQMLQERIEDPQREYRHQMLQPQLAVRDSSQFFGGQVK